MLKKSKKNNKGFTLVELLVVIAIIGILAVVAVPSLFKQMDKAKAAQVVSNVKALKTEILSEYANANTDDKLTKADGPFSTANITSLLELTNGAGKLGETYSVLDDDSKEEGKVDIAIKCTDNSKAKIVAQQLGVDVDAKDNTLVKYSVGKK